ncbi:adenylate kinase [Abeliophyllum distichum]|uniref:Adenylate kinase n=1 Tax=Abeliophyllum distichum TaxID=126358 RepID=A0ABD1VYT0_9LAMI
MHGGFGKEKSRQCNLFPLSPEFHCMAGSGFNLSLQPKDGQLESSSSEKDVVWKEKFRVYAEQRKPVEEYSRKQKKLLEFQVARCTWDTWQGLLSVHCICST